MSDERSAVVLIIESDIPEGMTLGEWRRTRTPSRGRPALERLVGRLCRARA